MMQINGAGKGSCPLCEVNQKEKPLFAFSLPPLSGDICSFHAHALLGLVKKAEQIKMEPAARPEPPRPPAPVQANLVKP